ncbi:MBL fold metallo-hydrolase [Niveibacterium umoris]|uniref:Metallo-beta-lactamase family protein n=1 Tax=Niveibacterium umoris TaxID=1193620 RepID=A0A840BKS4_9RHOO|nr:MBL fold metallo-hydrolase [Niveibacterium umoris]MBB4012149.1 metallo-beta-lactamase family protein [Niveibacterium umoris]
MISVRFCGAVGEVTGSGYWVDTGEARVLVDFGMFQGGRDSEGRNRVIEPVEPRRLVGTVLTHAHIDHSGRLPLLAAHGARAPIFATPATLELAEVLLLDSARIAEEDTARTNRRLRRAGRRDLSPLYTVDDVEALVRRFVPLPYGEWRDIAPGVAVRLHDAGHILGSSSVEMRIQRTDAEPLGVVFSGDLGARDAPILCDPQTPPQADVVFLESTYGDRSRPPRADALAAFHALLRRAVSEHRRMIVPAFAVGRSQVLLYELAHAFREGIVAPFPVFLDSPMASRASAIYARHRELQDAEARRLGHGGQVPDTLRIVESAAESRLLNDSDAFCMIMSAAGMCEGGRVLHHLRHNLWRKDVLVILPGYMAPGTLGRQLAEGAREVEIFGETIAVRAEVVQLEGFSAHADREGLLDWLAPLAPAKPRVVLTHGEDVARAALASALHARFGLTAETPVAGAELMLD